MTAPSRTLRVGGQDYPLLLPSVRDPRLHLAATIISLHVIGQAFLEFELSIAQILVSLLTTGVLEVVLTFRERRVFAWPASALLTGNGVAFVLRVEGTEHGDWWSLQGWYVFAATSALALLSKYVVRYAGRPVFNPSNLGLVVCFLVLGTDRVNPLDFWWGPLGAPMVAVLLVIATGGMAVTRRLGLLSMSLACWAAFALGLGVVAGTGHCMQARWSLTPVCGAEFWWILVTSPEILVFLLFMITDPKTAPAGRRGRLAFGVAVGLTAALLVAPTRTEFWSKVAVLASLVLVCALRVALQRWGLTERIARQAGPVLAAATAATLVLLVPAGLPAREPLAASSYAAPAGRPEVPVGDLPTVEVGPGVTTVAGGLDGAAAQQIARDLVADLEIERRALEQGDAALAATALAGARLAAATAAIEAGSTTPPAVWRFARLTVVVVRDPESPQAPPRLGVRAVGHIREPGGGETPRDTTFVLVRAGDVHLLEHEVPSA